MYAKQPEEIIFGSDNQNLYWVAFSDSVAGGRSRGSIETVEDHLKFHGFILPDINHGWVGLRSKKELHNLSAYKFVELKIKTDGHPYQFQLEHDPAWQEDKLSFTIDIVSNVWKVMHLDISQFKIYNTNVGLINRKPKIHTLLSKIYRYNILAVSKNARPFHFEIQYIKFH